MCTTVFICFHLNTSHSCSFSFPFKMFFSITPSIFMSFLDNKMNFLKAAYRSSGERLFKGAWVLTIGYTIERMSSPTTTDNYYKYWGWGVASWTPFLSQQEYYFLLHDKLLMGSILWRSWIDDQRCCESMSVLVMPCLEDSTPQFSTLFSSSLILSGFSPRTFLSLSECDIVVMFMSGY